MNIGAGQEIGDSKILGIAREYLKMRQNEFNLTSRQRSFCHHEIAAVENINGSTSRIESVLSSDQIVLMSFHYRTHLVNTIIANRELIP